MTGSSFYLWILDCYPGMVKLVDTIIQEVTSQEYKANMQLILFRQRARLVVVDVMTLIVTVEVVIMMEELAGKFP